MLLVTMTERSPVQPQPMELGFPATHDDLEMALVSLLARLEHFRLELIRSIRSRKLGMIVQAVQDMMSAVTGFADKNCPPDGTEDHRRCLAWLTQYHVTLQPLAAAISGSAIRSMLGLASKSLKPMAASERLASEKKLMNAVCETISSYFVIFTSRFESSRAARNWVETAASFLVELRRSVHETYSN